MADTIIDLDRALALLTRVVEVKGEDYVYPNWNNDCRYADYGPDGERVPGCIVGYALIEAGVPLDDLTELEGSVRSLVNEHVLEETVGVQLTPAAMRAWQAAQESQDDGSPWGKALIEAKHAAEEEK